MQRIHTRAPFIASFVLFLAACGGSVGDDLSHSGSPGAGGSSSAGTGGSQSIGGSGGTSSVGGAGGTSIIGGFGGAIVGGAGGASGAPSVGGSSNGGSSAAGASQGGTSQGGTSQGGAGHAGQPTGGTSQGGHQTGGSGGVSACCTDSTACGPGAECVSNVCKTIPPLPSCWSFQDCGPLGPEVFCSGGSVCPCGDLCPIADTPGSCVQGDTGGGPSCCTSDPDCGDFQQGECISGVCKTPLPQPQCWRDSDCFSGFCSGASVCGCDVVCGPGDTPGFCTGETGGSGGAPSCCVNANDCTGGECVQGACVAPVPTGSCWQDSDCSALGPGTWECDGALVCPCDGECTPAIDQLGMCVSIDPMATCPPSLPVNGTTCDLSENTPCQYGTDPRFNDCRQLAFCIGGAWQVQPTMACPPLPGPGVGDCPSDPTASSGHACAEDGEICDEGNGTVCACEICGGGFCSPDTKPTWACSFTVPPPCPAVAPDLGQACEFDPGVVCTYGVCGSDTFVGLQCQSGMWTQAGVGCGGLPARSRLFSSPSSRLPTTKDTVAPSRA